MIIEKNIVILLVIFQQSSIINKKNTKQQSLEELSDLQQNLTKTCPLVATKLLNKL